MRSLSSALQAAHSAAVQKPAWLLEIGFSEVVRLSSFDTITAFGESWIGAGFDLSGLLVDAARVEGSIRLPNTDNAYGALALGQGVSDKRIRVWGYDAGATATADFELLVDGVGAGVEINSDWVTIGVRSATEYVYAPRQRVNAAAGITYVLPAGALVAIGGTNYRIERGD